MTRSRRTEVLVLGPGDIDPAPFNERNLTLRRAAQLDDVTEERIAGARAIVISDHAGKYRLVEEYFAQSLHLVTSLGLRTAVQVTGANSIDQVAKIREAAYKRLDVDEDDASREWVMIGFDSVGVAEKFARHDPGPGIGTGIVTKVKGSKIAQETERLLRRSFWDCKEIVVEPLMGGKTATGTYRVHAELVEAGPQPMPFFVKHGKPRDIQLERGRYRQIAEPFIPFYLRPALDEARCVCTLTEGILVSNFVEGGIEIREAMRCGHGRGAIFSLFEVTLRGLRSHTMLNPEQPDVLATFLSERVKAKEISRYPNRVDCARRLGLRQAPTAIEEQLVALAKSVKMRRGHYHGDMHSGNILVRHGDSIVIDFGSMDLGPLSADPSVLEVSLVFGTGETDDPRSFDAWRELVDDLYKTDSPLTVPIVKKEHAEFAWLRKAVRELRHVTNSCRAGERECILVLVGCLLRFARLSPGDFTGDRLELSEQRRAYALVIAEHLTPSE